MSKNTLIPPSFSLIKKKSIHLLINDQYKKYLLEQGIEDIKTFLKKYQSSATFLMGRTPHLSVPIEEGKRMVIRQYSHGGLLRAFTGNLYLFGSRSFQELALTEEIRACGIPTILPIAAIHHPVFPFFYQAYFLSLEIPDAMDSIQYLQEIGSRPFPDKLIRKRKAIRSAGLLLRQFHQAGFFHRDLQLKNILIAGNQPLLIDFDRSYRKSVLSVKKRIKNLLRLNRSVEKWKRLGLPLTRTDCWRFFLAYAGEERRIQEAMRRTLQTYSIRLFFNRLGWKLEKIVRS